MLHLGHTFLFPKFEFGASNLGNSNMFLLFGFCCTVILHGGKYEDLQSSDIVMFVAKSLK
jgi:hypothetical protein